MRCWKSYRKRPSRPSRPLHRPFAACKRESIRHLTRRTGTMGTTTKTEPTVGRNRARESGPETELDEEREQQYDLLTAAIIGAAVGAGITLLLRRGPSGRRPVGPLVRYAGRGAALAGLAGMEGAKWAGSRGLEGARWAGERAVEGARWAA